MARSGLERLESLSSEHAWWAVIDTMTRKLLPETLEKVRSGFSLPVLRREAEPLEECAQMLRACGALPESLPQIELEMEQTRRILDRCSSSRFLSSLQFAMRRPDQALVPSGSLSLAIVRWPHLSGSLIEGCREILERM